jgi:hypothetical protein
MDEKSVISAVRPSFEADGIWSDVDQSQSMFLLVPNMFVHIVLKDASKYEAAVDALRRIQIDLKAQDEVFEWRARSIWKIARAEYRGAYYDKDGALRTASEILPLRVAFTHQAGDDLRTATGSAANNFGAHKGEKIDKTRKFIEFLLAAGGDMAWDPLWSGGDQLTIDSSAVAWILQEERRLAG